MRASTSTIACCRTGSSTRWPPGADRQRLVGQGDLPEHLIAGAAAFTFLLVAALVYPAGMGMGDVKLAGVMGLYLGLSIAPALLCRF